MNIYKKDGKRYAEVKEGVFIQLDTNKVIVLDKNTLELKGIKDDYDFEKATKKSWTSIHNSKHLFGTEVCLRWNSYSNFIEDMGFRPEGLCLVRKDKDEGFYKDNCEWAPKHKYSGQKNTRSYRV